jgi:hypothetical protein
VFLWAARHLKRHRQCVWCIFATTTADTRVFLIGRTSSISMFTQKLILGPTFAGTLCAQHTPSDTLEAHQSQTTKTLQIRLCEHSLRFCPFCRAVGDLVHYNTHSKLYPQTRYKFAILASHFFQEVCFVIQFLTIRMGWGLCPIGPWVLWVLWSHGPCGLMVPMGYNCTWASLGTM